MAENKRKRKAKKAKILNSDCNNDGWEIADGTISDE